MPRSLVRSIALLAGLLALVACARDGDQSVIEQATARTDNSPDEFAVLPRKPLILPSDLSALPEPTPGERNRTDLTPIDDLEVALSGRTGRAPATAGDRALLAALGPRDPGIRQILREEDAEWRDRNRGLLLERLLLKSTEGVVYDRMILDAAAELRRLRDRGIWTPPLPPE